MKIHRVRVEEAVESFARGGSGVVVGAPGSGKTYSLKRLVESLLEDPTAYPLFLAVDRFDELSEATLAVELGVEGDVFRALEADAAGATVAYFIVDALDAARSDHGRTQLLNLIRRARRELSARWRIIVSVRTYDASRSDELEAIFGPVDRNVPDDYLLGGVVCRHFFVPPLTEEEILSASDIPALASIWAGATGELRTILRNPFSLWVLERVLSSVDAGEIAGLRSEVELLSLFWRLRVEAGDRGLERRLILERIADAMLEARALSVPTAGVYRSADQAAWHDLHSGEILTSATTGHLRTSFAHNILFDYAVSVVSIDEGEGGLKSFLEQEPSRPLFLRPSLNYFFLRLWFSDRSTFWENVFAVARSEQSQVRLFTRVLPPTIIASEIRAAEEMDPLLERLDLQDPAAPGVALYVLQALRFAGVPRPHVWGAICESLAERVDSAFVWDMALVLDQLVQREDDQRVREQVGVAARVLLRWAFANRATSGVADRVGSVWLVPLVLRTIDTDVDASEALLRQVIDDIGDPNVSVDYATRFAHAIEGVWHHAPDLVSAFFVRCFGHAELSDAPTHMGGIVIALTSNRRQDFGMVQWSLKQVVPAFLRDVPESAIPAVIQSIEAQVDLNELQGQRQQPAEVQFPVNGAPATLRRDGSHFWDASGTIRDDAQELMDGVVGYLDELADAGRLDELAAALDRIVENAHVAFIWRRLLMVAAQRPAIYLSRLFDLLVARPILGSLETVREAAAFLSAALPSLSQEQTLAVELAIVALAADEKDLHESSIGRLIQRFSDDQLQTSDGRALKKATSEDPTASANPPLVEFHTSSEPYTEEMWLAEHGVDPADEAARLFRELGAPVEAFENDFRNAEPTKERVDAAISDLQRLRAALRDAGDLPEVLEDATWAKLGGASALLARYPALDPAQLAFVREILLECADGRAPTQGALGEFTTPAWSPAARNEAAQGLPFLAPTPDDGAVLAAIEKLSKDPVPSVRWLIAADLWRICESAPGVFWRVAESYLADEENATVIDAVARSLGAVLSAQRQPRVEAALQVLLDRTNFSVGTHRRFKGEDHLSNLLVGLAIGRGSEWAMDVIRAPLVALPDSGAEVSGYAWFALQYLHADRVDIPDFQPSAQRAIAWLADAVRRASGAIRAHGRDAEAPDGLKETFGVIDDVVSRLYFNSGVYVGQDRPVVPPGNVCQFFNLARDLMTTVAQEAGGEQGIGLPASTAHHFVELLAGVVQCDPATVVHLARLIVEAAGASGYAFDSLASREVTELVEQLLADHREVLRQGQPLDDLLFLLDTFVGSGSADAQRLVFRLEEIFR